jgi:hypothetical protein
MGGGRMRIACCMHLHQRLVPAPARRVAETLWGDSKAIATAPTPGLPKERRFVFRGEGGGGKGREQMALKCFGLDWWCVL